MISQYPNHKVGDRVTVNGEVGIVIRVNKYRTHAQIMFDNKEIGTYPFPFITSRNDLTGKRFYEP